MRWLKRKRSEMRNRAKAPGPRARRSKYIGTSGYLTALRDVTLMISTAG